MKDNSETSLKWTLLFPDVTHFDLISLFCEWMLQGGLGSVVCYLDVVEHEYFHFKFILPLSDDNATQQSSPHLLSIGTACPFTSQMIRIRVV